MPRLIMIALAITTSAVLGVGVAAAESETVTGDKFGGKRGDITKMTANNGQNAVVVSVFGLGKKCGGAQYLHVQVKNRKGRLLYQAEGSCISATWGDGLYYTATGKVEDATAVRCPKFELVRVKKSGSYRVTIPRACLENAPDAVKIEAEGMDFGSLTGGHAGPTSLLSRG